jgi:hypothetical protein
MKLRGRPHFDSPGHLWPAFASSYRMHITYHCKLSMGCFLIWLMMGINGDCIIVDVLTLTWVMMGFIAIALLFYV